MKLKNIIPILILLLGSVTILAQQGGGINELVQLGQVNYERQNYKTAYDFFKKAMKVDPNNPGASSWFWKMKSEHDVKNLADREAPITDVAMLARQAKEAEEKAKAAEEKARSAEAEAGKKAQEVQQQKEEKTRVVVVEKIREVPRIVRTGNPVMERFMMDRITSLNRQVASLKEELDKKKEPEREIPAEKPARTARHRDIEHGPSAWFAYGNYIPFTLFLLSFVLLVFTIYGITWSRRRNRLIPAPPQPAPAGAPAGPASGAGGAISAADNRAMVMELARKFMNSPDKDMNVVAPLLSHLIKSDGKAGMEEMLRTMPYLEEKVFGSHADGRLNNNLEVFANSFLFLMEKKLKRGNEALKVKTLCSETGLRLGLSQNEIQELRLAALIRDTGFLVVSQKLLLKKGPLTAREEQEMRKHVIYSAKIAQFMSLPERVINVIRNHHERFDGSGYPYGSSGEEIPFMARIVAPCESYVSLTSLRPYRRSLTSDQAMKKLQAEAGLFDPAVFKAFEGVIHSKLFLKENMLEPEIA